MTDRPCYRETVVGDQEAWLSQDLGHSIWPPGDPPCTQNRAMGAPPVWTMTEATVS